MTISLNDVNGVQVARLRQVQLHGLPGIGCYTLFTELNFTLTPRQNEIA